MLWKIKLPAPESLLILFLIGFVLAPFGDICHVLSNTSSYPGNYQHLFHLIPCWIPLQFGLATILIGSTHHNFLSEKLKVPTFWRSILSSFSLILNYSLSGILPFQPWLSFFLITIFLILNYRILDCKLFSAILAILTGLCGCLFEILLIKTRIFKYNIPHHYLIPIWLPLLYMHASLTIASFNQYLNWLFGDW